LRYGLDFGPVAGLTQDFGDVPVLNTGNSWKGSPAYGQGLAIAAIERAAPEA
jgi:hypothetical protein